jgi:hypothetical protein
MLKSKKIHILSFITTIILSFIPNLGLKIDGNYLFLGFPAQWFAYYGDGVFNFEILGLLFNLVIFYFLFILIIKVWDQIIFNPKNRKNTSKD